MNKFSGTIDGIEDSDYELVVATIRDFLKKIREGTPLEQADNWMREKHYSKEKLAIRRLSGDYLPMGQCYINLALVEMQREDKSKKQELPSPFSLSNRLNVESPQEELRVELPDLFRKRKLRDGHTGEPRRILIRGRAGVGKSTLCKKIVYDFTYKRAWRNIFDRVVWIQLRRLKTLPAEASNPRSMLKHLFFEQHEDGDSLSDGLWQHLQHTKSQDTLFLLDGLDEVAEILIESQHGNSHRGHNFLIELLRKPNVIITTRPHTKLPSHNFQQPHIELDTIGFSPDQVHQYIAKVLEEDPEKVKAIQSYLQSHHLMQSLVRIPIQLDAFCMTWKPHSTCPTTKDIPETMTAVYVDISQNLWRKDIERLEQREASNIEDAESEEIERFASEYSTPLEYLAFSGLFTNVIEFQSVHRKTLSRHLNQPTTQHTSRLELSLSKMFGNLSFLRTSDDSESKADRSYHFIHLTFQEYFAAKYFARKWKNSENIQYADFRCPSSNPEDEPCECFFQRHKYTARYDIMWRFVAGLLDAERDDQSTRFFEAMEKSPIDLLGSVHQRLVMHCLSEAVSLPHTIRAKREGRLQQWVLFESEFTGSSTFARDPELPEHVFLDALTIHRDQRVFLNAVKYSRRRLSDKTMSTLEELLKDKDQDIRGSAADALGSQSDIPKSAVTALVILVNDRDEDKYIRLSAIKALGNHCTRSEEAITALERLLNDEHEDKYVRGPAAEALGNESRLSEKVITALLRSLKNWHMIPSASEALGKQSTLSQTTMTALVSLLKYKEWRTRYFTGGILNGQSELSQETVADLKKLFKDDYGDVPFSAARTLGSKSGLSEAMITVLVELFRDDDWKVQCSVAAALGGRSTSSEVDTRTITSTLVELLAHQDKNARSSAATALSYQSELTGTAITTLVRLLDGEDWNVRYSAAEALGREPALPEAVVVVLLELFERHGRRGRLSAVKALGNQSKLSKSAIAFEKFLKDKDGSVRYSAAYASQKHLMLSETATLALVDLLKDENSGTRHCASHALRNQTNLSEPTIAALRKLFEFEIGEPRELAAEALWNQSMLSQPTVTALIKLLKDKNNLVQLSAAATLSKQSFLEEAHIYSIKELIESQDSTSHERSAAVIALSNQSIVSDEVMPTLVELLKDEDEDVQSSAVQSLLEKSTLTDVAVTGLVKLLKDGSSIDPYSGVQILDKQSMLSEAMSQKISTALVELFTEVDTNLQLDVTKAVGQRPNLMGSILEAIGLLISSDSQAETQIPVVHNLRCMEHLYGSLLWRSFGEQVDLRIQGDRCTISQESGLRTAALENEDSFRTAVSNAQSSLRNIFQRDIWESLEREDVN